VKWWNWLYETAAALRQAGACGTEALGFEELHRKGSHVKMKHSDGRVIVFPYHDEVDRFTLKGALLDADVDLKEFLNQL
jgi:predicted RNA binding protein YcfA (HicA-like mRNA interferase family)